MAALNIQIEIPNMNVYDLEELKHKLTVYAKSLISSSNNQTREKEKTYKHERLAGIFTNEKTENELKDDYIKQKYGI